eukprot:g1694.t1
MDIPTESTNQSMFSTPHKTKKNSDLSPAEQILAGTNQHQTMSFNTGDSDAFFNSYILSNSCDVTSMSRSMTVLGLSNSIPEEPSFETEFAESVHLQNAGKIASKSAVDLVGLNEEENDTLESIPPDHRQFSFQMSAFPSRCILLSNISPLFSDDQLRLLMQSFGEVQSMKTEYRIQGIVQVAYYDLRAAGAAKDQLNSIQIAGEYLSVHYAAPLGDSITEGTLLVYTTDSVIDSAQLTGSLVTYGDVKSIQTTLENDQYKLVEFYDIRHAKSALNGLNSATRGHDLSPVTSMKHTMSSQNLNFNNSVDLEEQDGSPVLNKSMSFGSGICELETQNPKTVLKGAIQLTPALMDRMRISTNTNSATASLSGRPNWSLMAFNENRNTGLESCWQNNGTANFLETLMMAQAAGVNLYEVLSKIPGANLGQLMTQSGTMVPPDGSDSYSLFNSLLSGVPMGVGSHGLVQSSGLDMGSSLMKSASSPMLRVGRDDRDTGSISRGGSGNGGGRLSRRTVDPLIEAERRVQQQKLYALDLEKIKRGEDHRTTLMIKNIPNKYTQKMLLASIDETLKGTYDFFYLPIDFKNKCNVGYGFINMRKPMDIVPLVERFHNKKWDRFNSEKVCCVAYGRIQGKKALINHFQNSSLMHEDKKHRPVLFVTEGPNKGELEPFPIGTNVRPRISVKDRDFRARSRS